ncbi:MAG: glutamate 5-kinase [Bradymonadia bacterium]
MSSSERPQAFDGATRVVVKIGSAVLRRGAGFDRVAFVSLVRDLAALVERGVRPVVVSSGAVALGMARMGVDKRPAQTTDLQALAAIGQGYLMRAWEDELRGYELHAAQLLLTHDDLRDRTRYLNACQTLKALLQFPNVVPIINENDTVAVDEIKMGDNDLLSAQVVGMANAGCLVILSDTDGFYDRRPDEAGAMRLSRIDTLTEDMKTAAQGSTSGLGSGGMHTKVTAMERVGQLGVPGIIAGGRTPDVLARLYDGADLGTWFDPTTTTLHGRKSWIATAPKSAGRIHVDAGARDALLNGQGSLLPVGIKRVEGDFKAKEVVTLVGPDGVAFARGQAVHGAEAIRQMQGKQSSEASAEGTFTPRGSVVVDRNTLVIPEGTS